MKTWGPRIVVIVILVAVAFGLRGRTPAPKTLDPSGTDAATVKPDWSDASQAVYDLFQAAGDGDDRAYLRLVDGQLRESLEQTRSDLGVERFRENLRRSSAGVKGVATKLGEGSSGEQVALDVEIVFADRNEFQRMLLKRKGAGWVIMSIEQARMIRPVVPYGTPVFEEPTQPNEP